MGIIQQLEQISIDTKKLMQEAGEVTPNGITQLFEDVFPTLPPNQPNFCDCCQKPIEGEGRFCSEECLNAWDEEFTRWKEEK